MFIVRDMNNHLQDAFPVVNVLVQMQYVYTKYDANVNTSYFPHFFLTKRVKFVLYVYVVRVACVDSKTTYYFAINICIPLNRQDTRHLHASHYNTGRKLYYS